MKQPKSVMVRVDAKFADMLRVSAARAGKTIPSYTRAMLLRARKARARRKGAAV